MIRREHERKASHWRRKAEYSGVLLHDVAWLLGFSVLSVVSYTARGRALQSVFRQLNRSTVFTKLGPSYLSRSMARSHD
jgi:hypothetical protein